MYVSTVLTVKTNISGFITDKANLFCLQGYYPSNKPGVEPRRPCRPVNITPWLHLSTVTNRVTITWGNFGKVSVQC